MTHDTEAVPPGPVKAPDADSSPRPLSLPWLAASIVLIASCAIAIASILAVLAVIVLYARLGLDGLKDLYQDLRFDLAFKTEVGAVVVGTFYVSLAVATVCASVWRGRNGWRRLIAWVPAAGRLKTVLVIGLPTVIYAGLTTYLLTIMQHRPVIHIDGPTNVVLLATFATNLVIMAPCAEELFFRGWLFTGLRERLSFWPTLLITATLFAAIHVDLHRPRVLLVLPLALATGFVRELTGSVKPAIALHVGYNLVIVTVKLWET